MSQRLLVLPALVAIALGCSSPPPPAPPPPPPPPPATAEAPPPPPKCEALEENCKAEAETRARVARSSLAFSPAAGWVYAQQETSTVAKGAAENGPAIILTAYEADAKDARKELAAREAAFADIAKQIGLTLTKKVNWRSPTCSCKGSACTGSGGELCKQLKPAHAELKSSVWQVDGGTRGGKKGPMLVVQAALPENKALIGLGFVPDDDSSGADTAILKSIESIGPAPAGAGGPDAPPAGSAAPAAGSAAPAAGSAKPAAGEPGKTK